MTDSASSDSDDVPGSEALREARALAEAKKRSGLLKGAVVTGIGSAALAAALLYANRGRKKGDQ